MQAKVRTQIRFKGPEMEGPVARWYAKLRRSGNQIEEYRKQAAQLTEACRPAQECSRWRPAPVTWPSRWRGSDFTSPG